MVATNMSKGLAAFMAAPNNLPKALWKNNVYSGFDAVNTILNLEGNGIAPLPPAKHAALQTFGEDLSLYQNEEIFATMAITDRNEFEEIATTLSGGRGLSMPKETLALSTLGTSTILGHPGQYQKLYRFTEDSIFDTDSLAAFHVNRREEDQQEVDEFMQVLTGTADWFFQIQGYSCLCSFPAHTLIYYHGLNPHGGYYHAGTRAVVLAQIIGPETWTMHYTQDANPIYEELKAQQHAIPTAEK